MKILRKNNWFQKFGKLSEKYYDGVWFNNAVILQSKYCNPTLNTATNSFRNKFGMA